MIKSGSSTYTSPPVQLVRQGKGKGCMTAMNVVQECQDDYVDDDDDLEGEGQGRTMVYAMFFFMRRNERS